MTESSLTELWPQHLTRLEALEASLLGEFERAWEAVEAALSRGDPAAAQSEAAGQDLASHRQARLQLAQRFLGELLEDWSRHGPDRRALNAVAAHDGAIEAWARGLPVLPACTGSDLAAFRSDLGAPSRIAWLYRLRRRARPLNLGAAADIALARAAGPRIAADGEVLTALAEGLDAVRRRWQVAARTLDAGTGGAGAHADEAEEVRLATTIAGVRWSVRRAVEQRRAWLRVHLLPALSRAAARDWTDPALAAPARDHEARAGAVAHWARLLRAARTSLVVARDLERTACAALERLDQLLASLEEERRCLCAELERMRAWADAVARGETPSDPGPPRVTPVPAAARADQVLERIEEAAHALPVLARFPHRFARKPKRDAVRSVYPRMLWLEGYRDGGAGVVGAALHDVQSEHEQVLLDIARARDVVVFSTEAAADGADAALAREGGENARSLLTARLADLRPLRARMEPQLAAAVRTSAAVARALLFRAGFALWLYRTRRRAEREGRTLLAAGAGAALGALRRLLRVAWALALRWLVRIGWRAAPEVGPSEVTVRPLLPVEFTTDAAQRDLPALYRHLFRPTPVEDPRFLTGREAELDAAADARRLWESGRAIAVLVVGERGSGKTSLLNCALRGPLDGLPVVRGEVRARADTAAALRAQLAELLGADAPDRLEEVLRAERRVVVLEELERTFLRQIGHFEAVHELQRLIAATADRVLWIAALNQTAFRFLDAATGLGQRFSHRVNAGSASRDDLRRAILFRHGLSGLRLQFEAGSSPRGRAARLLAQARGKGTAPEDVFFDALARQSGGVFRSAFALWLSHCEALDGGVLSVRPLAGHDLAAVTDQLALSDLFALVAILQHGSLTAAEHAVVFHCSEAESRAQIDELRAREIVEAEPNGPGYRVRPAAMLVVREALFRRNLL